LPQSRRESAALESKPFEPRDSWYDATFKASVFSHYEGKTGTLVRRQQARTRIHYHSGIESEPPDPRLPLAGLEERIHGAQERLIERVAEGFAPPADRPARVLDFGCGLGGGSLYWAQELGAEVTGVTIAPSHAAVVMRCAQRAGVGDRVGVVVADILDYEAPEPFDVVVAMESSCCVPRGPLFARLAGLLRPGGRILLSDYLRSPDAAGEAVARTVDRHWSTRLGTFEEYADAADGAGFERRELGDLSSETARFWEWTRMRWEREAKERRFGPDEAAKTANWIRSVAAHSAIQQGLVDGSLAYRVFDFRKP